MTRGIALSPAHVTGRACWAFTWQERTRGSKGQHCQGRPALEDCCALGMWQLATVKENRSPCPTHTQS